MNEKKARYQVIESEGRSGFLEQVNTSMEAGWVPKGGVVVNYVRNNEGRMQYYYAQAMILQSLNVG